MRPKRNGLRYETIKLLRSWLRSSASRMRWHGKRKENTERSDMALAESQQKLNEARADWAPVLRARDRFADLIETAWRAKGDT